MTERKPSRFEIRLPPDLEDRIDEWRRAQPDLPPRAEAARRLIEAGLNVGEKLSSTSPGSGGFGASSKPQRQSAATEKPATRKAPRAKPLAMSKEAQLRALRERSG